MEELDEVIEGFLCPLCYTDLGNISKLHDHFEDSHQEDKDLIQTFKDIFGKAKKALKIEDTGKINREKQKSIYKGGNIYQKLNFENSTMPLGMAKNLYDSFKTIRSERYDKYLELSNKLIVKLDLLFNTNLTFDDLNARKDYDKSIVDWIPDNLVNICPYCHKGFQLPLRRKHHCRLCGAILCHKCSHFLTSTKAQILFAPVSIDQSSPFSHLPLNLSIHSNSSLRKDSTRISSPNVCPELSVIDETTDILINEHKNNLISKSVNSPLNSSNLSPNLTTLKRTDSITSINSYVSSSSGTPHIRICLDCSSCIEKRVALAIAQRSPTLTQLSDNGEGYVNLNQAPKIIQFQSLYKELWTKIRDVRKMVPSYCSKVESLNIAHTKSPLILYEQALEIRNKIMKNGERIESLSRVILSLTNSSSHSVRQEKINSDVTFLQKGLASANPKIVKSIRLMACNFLKDYYLTLPNLPERAEFSNGLQHAVDEVGDDSQTNFFPSPSTSTAVKSDLTNNYNHHNGDRCYSQTNSTAINTSLDDKSHINSVDFAASSLFPLSPPGSDSQRNLSFFGDNTTRESALLNSVNSKYYHQEKDNPFDLNDDLGGLGNVGTLTSTTTMPPTTTNPFDVGDEDGTNKDRPFTNDRGTNCNYHQRNNKQGGSLGGETAETSEGGVIRHFSSAPPNSRLRSNSMKNQNNDKRLHDGLGVRKKEDSSSSDHESYQIALSEQIEIVKGYLEKALNTDNLDEVYALETNLKELQIQLDLINKPVQNYC